MECTKLEKCKKEKKERKIKERNEKKEGGEEWLRFSQALLGLMSRVRQS